MLDRHKSDYYYRPACLSACFAYPWDIDAKTSSRKFEYGRLLWRLLLAGAVIAAARYYPGWRFAHMTAAEHLEAARTAVEEGRFGEAVQHANALAPDGPEAVRLRAKIWTAQNAERQLQTAAQQKAASIQLAVEAQAEAKRLAARELEADLKNRGYDVTVTHSGNLEEVIITGKGFDDPDQRDRFLTFLHGESSPAATACAAGIQAVRLKGPGVFFGFSDKYSLDCYMR